MKLNPAFVYYASVGVDDFHFDLEKFQGSTEFGFGGGELIMKRKSSSNFMSCRT